MRLRCRCRQNRAQQKIIRGHHNRNLLSHALSSAREDEGHAQTESDWNGKEGQRPHSVPGAPRYGKATKTKPEKTHKRQQTIQ
jgi:hypothetical protein